MPTYTTTINGQERCEVVDAAMSWGRPTLGQQPPARVLTVTLDDPGGTLAAGAAVGQPVTFDVDPGIRRFTGTLADVPSYDPMAGLTTINAVSDLAALGRTFGGDEPWPVELDGERAERILTLAGYDTSAVDPGWAQLLGVDIDRQPFLQMLHDTAASAGAVVVDLHDGRVAYQDIDHRAGVPGPWASSYTAVSAEHPTYSDIHTDSAGDTVTHPDYFDLWRYPHPHPEQGTSFPVIDACDLDGEVTWSRTSTGLVNRVVVRYGDPEATYDVADTPSVLVRGEYSVSVSTQLVALADAQTLAATTLTRRSGERWALTPLRLIATTITDTARTLLTMEAGDTFQVVNMSPEQIVEQTQLVLEGGRETYTAEQLVAEFTTSDFTQVWDTQYGDLTGSTYADLDAAHPDYAHLLIYGGS